MSYSKISLSDKKNALLSNDKLKITGLIIAAGLSSRIGNFKPLLKWNGRTFLSNIIRKLEIVCDDIIIITGNESERIKKYLDENYSFMNSEIQYEHNPDYLKGMFTSLKKGIDLGKEADWILYHQVDQPNLPSNFYKEFIEVIDVNYDWIQPRSNEKNGHPILLGKKIIEKILNAHENTNLRMLSNNSDILKNYWDCDYSEIFTDIDNEEDFKKLIDQN